MIINFLKNDTQEPWGTFFLDSPVAQIEQSNIMYYLAIFFITVCWTVLYIVLYINKNFRNKYVNPNKLIEIVLGIYPCFIFILFILPLLKLLYLLDDAIDPTRVIDGFGHSWYLDYPHYSFTEVEQTEEKKDRILYYSFANDLPFPDSLNDKTPGMIELAYELKKYEGKTLRESNITVSSKGTSWTRISALTSNFHVEDPGAFLPFDPDATVITPYFIQRVLTFQSIKESRSNYIWCHERWQHPEFETMLKKKGLEVRPSTNYGRWWDHDLFWPKKK